MLNSFPMLISWGPSPRWMPTAISGINTVDFSGSEGGVDTGRYRRGHRGALLGALAKVTGMVKKESLAKIIADVAAMERGYNEVKIEKFRKARAEYFWGTLI